MRWPLVARGTLDGIVRANEALGANLCSLMSERDFLRSQLALALEQNRRIARREAGLPDQQRRDKADDAVPANIRKLASQFGSSMTQQDQLSRAKRAHAEGMTWEEVEATMLAALNEGQ